MRRAQSVSISYLNRIERCIHDLKKSFLSGENGGFLGVTSGSVAGSHLMRFRGVDSVFTCLSFSCSKSQGNVLGMVVPEQRAKVRSRLGSARRKWGRALIGADKK